MQFYTEEYLKTNPGGWNGKPCCPNLSKPGPYGLGPYILTEGYIEGDRQTPKAVLKANPYYWDPNYPKVEKITIYTELDTESAKDMTLYEEGKLDITVIPPEAKVATIMAPFSKLVISPSTDNIAIHMNLINGNRKLLDQKVRRALNEALNHRNLLHFVFEDEGYLSPISPHFPGVDQVSERLLPFPADRDPYDPVEQQRLKSILDGLQLTVLTQDRYRSMWRGIETQLNKVGVKLDIEFTTSEKDIFGPLLKTNAGKNQKQWDLLVWGNDDWYFNHPFTAFFVFRTHNMWSTVYPDETMDGFIEEMFQTPVSDKEAFARVCEKIMQRAYDEAYMLFVPTPNKVFAVNKEVVFRPYKMACIPLWKIQVTNQHWSVRKGDYPKRLRRPVQITRAHQAAMGEER
jgi:ABC-type transport system substrate-binding protein